MILYHGSNMEIKMVDLSKCQPYKDFGQGFYTTSLQEQAVEMAKRTALVYGGKPIVTIFEIKDEAFHSGEMNIRIFPSSPTVEWVMFIHNNRRRDDVDLESTECNKDCKYDIVIGPVADDNIARTIRQYVNDEIDREYLKKRLTYRKLTNQYSFHTERALVFLGKAGVLDE